MHMIYNYMKNKRILLKIVSITIFLLIFLIAYCLLLEENSLNISISSIINSMQHSALARHLIVLSLLPCYIAFIIFGAGFLGIYLASKAEKLLTISKKKRRMSR
jgi:hypothetical protein